VVDNRELELELELELALEREREGELVVCDDGLLCFSSPSLFRYKW
jgi:hypothetical protein